MKKAKKYFLNDITGILVALGVASFVVEALILHSSANVTKFILFAILFYSLYLKDKDRKSQELALRKKGSTPKDVNNMRFVKDWKLTKRTGFFKYCLFNGGLIIGMLLWLPISFAKAYYTKNNFSEFNGMINFTAECLIISYVTGVFIYLLRWHYNQRKFVRLTDPLNSDRSGRL